MGHPAPLTSTAGNTKTVGLALQLYEEVGGIPGNTANANVAVSNSSDQHTSFLISRCGETERELYFPDHL